MKISILCLLAASTATSVAFAQPTPPAPPIPRDTESVVTEMMVGYDNNEDNTLDEAELTAAFIGIRAQHQAINQANCLNGGSGQNAANGRGCQGCRQGKGPRKGKGPGQGFGMGRGTLPPEQLAPALIAHFDTNSDAALDTEELFAAISFHHEQMTRRPGWQRAGSAESTQ